MHLFTMTLSSPRMDYSFSLRLRGLRQYRSLRIICKPLPDYTVLHPRIQYSSSGSERGEMELGANHKRGGPYSTHKTT
jgi:hypothetical protein